MARRIHWMPGAVAVLPLLVPITLSQVSRADDARAPKANRAGHPRYPDFHLTPAVREYLVQLSQKRPIDPRISDVWGPNSLTPKEREDRELAIYRSDHNGAEPPKLTCADSDKVLGDYGNSPALKYLVSENTQSVDLFYATWFPGNSAKERGDPEYACDVSVTPAGCIMSYLDMWDWAEQGVSSRPEPPEFITAVRQLLKTLPPGEKHPAPARLLIVTFRTAGGWETRLYDRTHMAPCLAQILNVIGKQLSLQFAKRPPVDYAALVAR